MNFVSRKLNENNDIYVDNTGNLALIYNADQLIQAIKTRLWFFLGEFFLDNTVGFPWYELVLKKNVNTSNIESRIKLEISNTPGFGDLTFFSMDYEPANRTLFVQFRGTINGEETDNIVVEAPQNG